MNVTLGGDRLGSGNKNKQHLRNYERSTHDLTQKFTSSMQVGTLYPFLVIPAMRGDKFEINLEADTRTIPTKAPLFGSFKMQMDIFQYPIRLCQAILHNNPLNIGMNMAQVKFPMIQLQSKENDTWTGGKLNDNCLLKYLGFSGMGVAASGTSVLYRKVNAIPALAYYEIFKTYYSNKQEENAYIIGAKYHEAVENDVQSAILENTITSSQQTALDRYANLITPNETLYRITLRFNKAVELENLKDELSIYFESDDYENGETINDWNRYGANITARQLDEYKIEIHFTQGKISSAFKIATSSEDEPERVKIDSSYSNVPFYTKSDLIPFPLKNIDNMRLKLLSFHGLGNYFQIANTDTESNVALWNQTDGESGSKGLPYTALCMVDGDGYTLSKYPMQGLCIKTYQSDIFNNWIQTEWIDGDNGIAAITAISTSDGKFTIDSLNLAEKLYNMMNRVAVADGTFDGWQDAVFTETPRRHIESPVYLGGMSSEIVFEEIVQTSADGQGLGTLAGKGKILKNKGGKVTVKVDEASFIIGIVSFTPRINYSQSNEFYMTDLLSMDDFHKPALDGIGFQNLIGERLAWFDTEIEQDGANTIYHRNTIGKIPAWLEYMTAVDKTFGDFASPENENGCMVLNRSYDRIYGGSGIADATTYIDPRKYNYAFAYTEIDSQNFWAQIYSHITARRLMSAKQIPNI